MRRFLFVGGVLLSAGVVAVVLALSLSGGASPAHARLASAAATARAGTTGAASVRGDALSHRLPNLAHRLPSVRERIGTPQQQLESRLAPLLEQMFPSGGAPRATISPLTPGHGKPAPAVTPMGHACPAGTKSTIASPCDAQAIHVFIASGST